MAKRLKLNIGADGKLSVMDQETVGNGSGSSEGEEKRKFRLRGEVISCGDNKLRYTDNHYKDSIAFFETFFAESMAMGVTGTVLYFKFFLSQVVFAMNACLFKNLIFFCSFV